MDNTRRSNLDKALALFIEALRLFISAEMEKEYGASWSEKYRDCLTEKQKKEWDIQLAREKKPISLIDFNNLGIYAIKQKHFLKKILGHREVAKLPTKFNEITEARNMAAHYAEWDQDKVDLAFSHMIDIAKLLSMDELEEELRHLKEGKSVKEQIAEVQEQAVSDELGLVAWFNNVKPHLDIRQGRLDESVFAADLAEVALNKTGREVYSNSSLFFDKTYFTEGLTNIANRVIKGLNGKEAGENRVISLQTGFGGGKTHTLISLYHLAKAGKEIARNSKVADKLKERVDFDQARIAVFTNSTNDPIQGRKEGDVHIRTLWGDLAYQLGGIDLYEKIRPNDEARTAPKGLFTDLLKAAAPCLILIDELADYCVAASGVKVGGSTLSDQTISFMQELTEAVAKVENCVAVITLPASAQEVANSQQAASILQSLESRVKRVGADTKPVSEEEIFEVIRYRLFEGIGDERVTEKVLAAYSKMYEELWTELPSRAPKREYAKLMARAYPFHPELINIFKDKWASHPQFQRTRGVLRLLASIVSDLWKRRSNLVGNHTLIHPSHLQLDNLDTLTGEIKKLYGLGYDAVISSDVCGINSNAYQIDQEKEAFGQYALTQGIATAIFLNSFGKTSINQGITIQELKLQLLTPGGFNHNTINSSLDELQNRAFYLYYAQGGASGQRFWFHTKPNLNILVNSVLSDIRDAEVEAQIIQLLSEKAAKITKFRVLVAPEKDVPEQKSPTLIVLHPSLYHNGNAKLEKVIKEIALHRGHSDRVYRNTLLFLSISIQGRSALYNALREYRACLKIKEDYQLEADQKEDLQKRIEEANQKVRKELVTAYNQVHKYTAAHGLATIELRQFSDTFDSQITVSLYEKLKEEEWMLESVGFNTLRKNNLLPEDGHPLQAKEVLEAFLRYDDKPMIYSKTVIDNSLIKYCVNKQFAIAAKSIDDWMRMYYGEPVPTFDAMDESFWLVSIKDYETWLKAQKSQLETEELTDGQIGNECTTTSQIVEDTTGHVSSDLEVVKKIIITGKVGPTEFNQLFKSFFLPLKENEVEMEFKIVAKSKSDYPLTKNSTQYKIARESADQLGFEFDEE